MAISKVSFIRQDGNLTATAVGTDHISGLLFDIPADTQMPSGVKLNDVVQIFSVTEAISLGITEYDEEKQNFFYGIPYFHISEFFRMKPDGSLFVMFADCSKNWNAIKTIQSVAQGNIKQLGVWTPQNIWSIGASSEDPYTLNLVPDINTIAEELANDHQPLSILLTANSTTADSTGATKTISLIKIPTCKGDYPRVTVLLGQGKHETLRKMQIANLNHSSIGCVGVALGCVAEAKVHESIAWVSQFNLNNKYMANIEFGFGDISLNESGDDFVSMLQFESLASTQIDEIDNKGYVFPIKYAGRANGTHFNKDTTCSTGDYRTIARNRTIDKSRRAIRNALLPYLNSPILVNPKTGYPAEIEIKKYQNVVKGILETMEGNGEISGSSVLVATNQNILLTDELKITYAIVPVGVNSNIIVEEGFALTNA